MKNQINQVKKFAIVLFALPLLAVVLLNSSTVRTRAANEPQDMAAAYKENKCSVCHGEKAEKKFDATKTDDQLVGVVMKGFKGEKPPFMPSYEAKGMTADQAKALVAYMKSLK
jgi:mono/diheme cytochrome c family protein